MHELRRVASLRFNDADRAQIHPQLDAVSSHGERRERAAERAEQAAVNRRLQYTALAATTGSSQVQAIGSPDMELLPIQPLDKNALDAYKDDEGRPMLRQSAFLFLDLLGTTARDAADPSELLKALTDARFWGGSEPSTPAAVARWFSDNLGLAYPIGDDPHPNIQSANSAMSDIIFSAAMHQIALFDHGFSSRGGISVDRFYADEAMLYGPALNRAVQLEKERAKYPRVVLDEAAVRIAKEALKEENPPRQWARNHLLIDADGVVFVHWLAAAHSHPDETADKLDEYRVQIAELLAEHDGCTVVHDKYRWLAAYFDYFIENHRALNEDQRKALLVDQARPWPSTFEVFGENIPAPTGW